ncbi:MAG: 30S ribosome-binding factor RbfA [Candidatus Neomarinimicrobiota bacterium]|nr:30S ribosome-binding factor RbfA [Candidatus Neomarinimicrobiota bacterium]RKY50537.1 MAG: 30S ribosome-binding factor RbfA [Candidatus Neomarinimicrobiota bacterium]HDN59197.1 30S ribosome-binding factor RbfA [Candidatus Neomarinimicrobiota bacterium]
MMKTYSRAKRVSDELQRVLSNVIVTDDPYRLGKVVTISKVECSPDLRQAKVFVSVYDKNPKERRKVIRKLRDKSGNIRYELGRRIRLKNTPKLLFFEDDTQAYMEKIERIFQKIKYSNEESGTGE